MHANLLLGKTLSLPSLPTDGSMVAPNLAHVVVRCAPPLIPNHPIILALFLDLKSEKGAYPSPR